MSSFLPPGCAAPTVGVIGGSGVYAIDGLTDKISIHVPTPFGEPSDEIIVATIDTIRCAFLPRHHHDHKFTPTEVNYRANIWALKALGVKYLLSVTAVGSLRAHLKPGEMCFPSQIIDRTVHRKSTYFENGIVGHVPFGDPICMNFRALALEATAAALPNVTVHPEKPLTLVTIEGPAFSTKAESLMNRQMGGDLVGMTTATEAKLAREAELSYCVVSMVTDMDSWSDEPHVDVNTVVQTLHANAANAQIFIKAIVTKVGHAAPPSDAFTALQYAVMTKKGAVCPQAKERLSLLIDRLQL